MSVINNVLKDLESRESQFTPIEIDAIGIKPTPARDLKPLLLVGLLLLLLMAGAWIYLQDQLIDNGGSAAPSIASTPPVVVAPPVVEPEVNQAFVTDRMIGNQIIGLQIRESEDDMRMEFALRDKVVAFLKQRGENSFGYHLRDIESQIFAPVISDNRWIRELAITSSSSGVDVNFQTAEDILVETRQSLVDGEPVWVINLRKTATPVVANTVVENIAVGEPAAIGTQQTPETMELASTDAAADEVELESRQASDSGAPAAVVKLDIKSTNPNAKTINQLEYAVELMNSRRFAKAQATLQNLLGGSEDYDARQHLLALYSSQNKNDRFLRLVRESMTKYPDDPLFKTEYARSLFQVAAYRSVIQLFANKNSLEANQQALVAASYQRLDEHESAVRHYQLALEQDAANAKNWIGLGISQEQTAALEGALHSYQQAAKLGNLNNRLQAFVDNKSRTLRQVLN
jgi:Flp pilus assembly protein TadD